MTKQQKLEGGIFAAALIIGLPLLIAAAQLI
jgi:hypothetical protein